MTAHSTGYQTNFQRKAASTSWEAHLLSIDLSMQSNCFSAQSYSAAQLA